MNLLIAVFILSLFPVALWWWSDTVAAALMIIVLSIMLGIFILKKVGIPGKDDGGVIAISVAGFYFALGFVALFIDAIARLYGG